MADGAGDPAVSDARGAELAVRVAVIDDAVALTALVADLGYPATQAQLQVRLRRLLADARVHVIVSMDRAGGDVVGLCTVHLLSTIHGDADVAQITALVVSERVRGRGAGRQLVTEAERWARERGAGRIVVTTALHRGGAHVFYERLGYTHSGRRYGRTLA